MANTILHKSSIKLLFLTSFVFAPLFLFSDGGVLCTSYEDYDVQPTTVEWFDLLVTSYKVNGKEMPFTADAKAAAPNTMTLSDSSYINFMKFNRANTEIVSVSCGGLGESNK